MATLRKIVAAAAPLYRNLGGRACSTTTKGGKQEKEALYAAPGTASVRVNKEERAREWWEPDPAGVWLPEGNQIRLSASPHEQAWFRDDVHNHVDEHATYHVLKPRIFPTMSFAR